MRPNLLDCLEGGYQYLFAKRVKVNILSLVREIAKKIKRIKGSRFGVSFVNYNIKTIKGSR